MKTDDGNIAWAPGDPANGALTTIAELLRKEKGFSIGVVSTGPFTHATPAAHVSHNKSRNNYTDIANEIIRTIQPEVVIGGGYPGAGGTGKYNYIGKEEYDLLKNPDPASPYRFVEREPGVDGSVSVLEAAHDAAEQGKKLFGLFGGSGRCAPSIIQQPGRRTAKNLQLIKRGFHVTRKAPDGQEPSPISKSY